jgi:hypothetical protein
MAKSRKGAFVGLANRDYQPFTGSIGSRLCRMPNANFVERGKGEVRILGILRSSHQTADGGTMHPWEADRLGWILGRELEDAAA